MNNLKKILIISLIACIVPAPIFSQPQEEEKSDDGWGFTPLPLPSYNDDIGFTYGLRVTATKYEQDYKPYKMLIWAQYLASTKGFEDHAVNMDVLDAFGSGIRLKARIAYARTLLAQYYGFGNNQDIRRIQKIKDGRVAIGENIPTLPTVVDGVDLADATGGLIGNKWSEEFNLNENFLHDPVNNIINYSALNPGRRILRERQNRYFAYDRTRPYAQLSAEDFIGNSNFKWFIGFRGQRYKIQSYFGRKEDGEAEENSATLLDIEQPYGYDAITEDERRFVNAGRVALAYDSRPRSREPNPNSGIFTDIHYEGVGKAATGSHYDFHRLTGTWRQYMEFFPDTFNSMGQEFVFAYRVLAQETYGDVPFFEKGRIYNLNEDAEGLGGSGGIRGFPSNQFVDNVMTLANLEMRYTFSKKDWLGGIDWQLMAFYDIGRVAEDWKEWQPKGMHKAWGPGISMVWKKTTIVTILLGKSEFESFTAFKLSHLF